MGLSGKAVNHVRSICQQPVPALPLGPAVASSWSGAHTRGMLVLPAADCCLVLSGLHKSLNQWSSICIGS